MQLTAFSLFAGIGGFDIAFERAGIDVVGQCENEPHCQEVLGKHFPGVPLTPDVREVQRVTADIVVGGFPCQDVSVAGRRAGLAGERSGLWFEFARILEDARPRWCLIENVSGLLSSNRGRDMGTILAALGELGYGFAYRVLDAQFFGVPQRRRRVFVVGHLGDARRAAEILLEPDGGCWNPPTREDARQEVAGTLAARTQAGGYPGTDESIANHVVPARQVTTALTASSLHVDDATAIAGFLPHSQSAARRLMPIECERLQGFPDNWTEGHADTHRYRMLGNAVAVPVAEWIARRIASNQTMMEGK